MTACAQIDDSIAIRVFLERRLDPANTQLNAIQVIPELYRKHEVNTLNAVVRYWEKKGRMSEPLFSYRVIEEIRTGIFKEQMYPLNNLRTAGNVDYYKTNIIRYLKKYLDGSNISTDPKRYFHTYTSPEVITAYAQFYTFLQSISEPLCSSPNLTKVEDFLVHFYACPDTQMFQKLGSSKFKHTLIGNAVQHKGVYSQNTMADVSYIHGVHLELNTGAWVYSGNLHTMQPKPEPALGFKAGGRWKNLSYDFSCQLHWSTSPGLLTVFKSDSLYNAHYGGAGYLAIDWGYQVYRRNRVELDLLAGMGYSTFDVTFDSSKNYSYHSPIINLGIGCRYYFRHRQFDDREVFDYILLQPNYHLLFYRNPEAVSLNGQAFSLTVAIGCYSTARIAFSDVSSETGNAISELLKKGR